jgi:Zn-finger nucleic acid-binding protein
MELTCPKCRGQMRSYERSGITVDQCTECRGIFLDRGELEKLVDAEESYHAAPAGAPAGPPPAAPPAYGYPRDDRPRYDDDRRRYEERKYEDRKYDDRKYYGDSHHYKKNKRRSFMEELFD